MIRQLCSTASFLEGGTALYGAQAAAVFACRSLASSCSGPLEEHGSVPGLLSLMNVGQMQHHSTLEQVLELHHQQQQQHRACHELQQVQHPWQLPLQTRPQHKQQPGRLEVGQLQLHHQQQRRLWPCVASGRAFGSSAASAAQEQQQTGPSISSEEPKLRSAMAEMKTRQQLDDLLQVLLHPMPRTASWNAQLSPYLLEVNQQLLLQPSAVLLSVVRALHVLRGVLKENGQVYVVENNPLLRPLVKAAALSSINPNLWFDHRTWTPGTLTNYASTKQLFRESHQPNRRLFAAKGYRPVNPLCPVLPALMAPLPRLSTQDQLLLLRRTRRPGYRQLLEELMSAEDAVHRFKPAGSLRGTPQDLQLMVFLDSSKNAVAIREAYNRNIPTIAIVNSTRDMSQVTYPVLARDFSPTFVHFFLNWILKVANAAPAGP